jgi:hypothetical protein
MAAIKAVKETEPDPKTGKPRPQSGTAFPYYNLDKSVELAKLMHDRAGGVCDRAQLAPLLGYSGINNGGFLSRVSAAKMFGLIEDTDDRKLRVSARGRAIVAPISAADASRARVEAFMSVELFRKVYDQYHGSALPENAGLQNLLQNEYRVVVAQVAPTVRIMLDSAEQAGLFSATNGNRTRMVMPLMVASVTPLPTTPAPPIDTAPRGGNGGGSGGGGDDLSGIDGAFVHLLKRLPTAGTALPTKRRKAFIDAFTATLGVVYPDAEDAIG